MGETMSAGEHTRQLAVTRAEADYVLQLLEANEDFVRNLDNTEYHRDLDPAHDAILRKVGFILGLFERGF